MTSNDTASFEKSWFYVAQHYIQASKNLLDGMLKTENPDGISSKHEISEDEITQGTRYSSQSIILPTLFCLYQGIELILKGFVSAKCNIDNIRHEAESLCKKFSALYSEEKELGDLFSKFVFSPKKPIKEYMKLNGIKKINVFYNSLRYPDEKVDGLKIYRNYYPLEHPDNKLFLPQVKELNNEIKQLLILSVRLFRKLEDKAKQNKSTTSE